MFLSIVIPAYNEEKRVGTTLEAYSKFFRNKFKKLEILVVVDGTDDTDKIVRNMSKKYRFIKLIKYDHRLGKGGGVYEGFKAAKGEIIGFTDADNSVNAPFFEKVLEGLKKSDCSIGSRRMKGSAMILPQSTTWIVSMRIVSRIYNSLVKLILFMNIQDTQCGAKVMKRKVYEAIKNDLNVTGFEFDVELLWRIKKNGFKIIEVPVIWKHNLESKSSIKNSVKFFVLLFKLRFGIN